MHSRSLFVVAALLVAVILTLWVLAEHEPPPSPSLALRLSLPEGAATTAADSIEISSIETDRVLVSRPAETKPATPQVSPWTASFLVVDDARQPVEGATITVSALWSLPPGRPQTGVDAWGRAEPPLLELQTDVRGRANAVIPVERFLAVARKDGWLKSSGPTGGRSDNAGDETILVLRALIPVHGIVLDTDERPAAGASVSGIPERGSGRPPVVATAGADGRFTLLAGRNMSYGLTAESAGRKTLEERVLVTSTLPDVTLRLAGRIKIHGFVINAEGKQVLGAKVMLRREGATPDHFGDQCREAWTVDDGFLLVVPTYARYQLIASKHEHSNSRPVWVETTVERPDAEVRLQLLPIATIRGRVVHDDGRPCAGMLVSSEPESDASFERIAWDRKQRYASSGATTADDGTFELSVHPDATWTVIARNNGNPVPEVRLSGVTPGRGDVVLVVTKADVAGCVVHGTVVRSDGEPAVGYQVFVAEYDASRAMVSMNPLRPADAGHTFTLAPLPLGRRYAITVTASRSLARDDSSLAPAQSEIFLADRSEMQLAFRLQPWGTLPVRLVDAASPPAGQVWVVASSVVTLSAPRPRAFGLNDRVRLTRLTPGANVVRAYSDDGGLLCEQDVVVAPGLNPEVSLLLRSR